MLKLELLPIWLVVVPLVTSFLMLIFRSHVLRIFFVVLSSIIIGIGSLGLILLNFKHQVFRLALESHAIHNAMMIIELALTLYIIYVGIKSKRYLISILAVVQSAILFWFELFNKNAIHVEHHFFIDSFSIVMGLIVGIIGSLIAVYSLGYMKAYHEGFHKEVQDRRPFFFFVIFIFLSAMFGIVFANSLLWFYFFWEITTICSFILIEYKRDEESKNNALRALLYNLIGGVCFAAGIVFCQFNVGTIELDKLMVMKSAAVLLPVVLFAFAGLTKSAQFPFSSWLLGAMVAPTPVSALLHSSTMVKAGVYLLVRMASPMENTAVGLVIALIGAFTFLFTAFIAMTQSDAKKVLAYSTISNLGLIVMCAGIGTYEAVWAAVLLIIFHALAKCLLFLTVGSIEQKIHSRNIEDMGGLIVVLPKLSIMLQIGIAGMFLAPFGMLISKWAVLKALLDWNPIIVIFILFGSSATLFFWVKWLGKLLSVISDKEEMEDGICWSEWLSLTSLAGLTVGICAFFPLVASVFIEPFVYEIYARTVDMGQGNMIIMIVMLAMVMLFPLSFFAYGKRVKVVDAFLSGSNTAEGSSFYNSFEAPTDMEMKNMYLEKYFKEKLWFKSGIIISTVLMFVALILLVVPK